MLGMNKDEVCQTVKTIDNDTEKLFFYIKNSV